MQSMHIHVLGPEGSGRAALEAALARLGCTVSGAEPGSGSPEPAADALMLDARGDQSVLAGAAAGLVADRRPAMVVSERPSPLVRELARRPGGTVLVTGAESEAGYRVALSLVASLRGTPRAQGAGNGSLARTAAL
jgi:hypothetical protein